MVKAYENAHALKYAIHSAIERKEFENELYRKANFDSITDLPNFRFLQEHLEVDISKARRWGKQIALMFVDIYKFKDVNDSVGHENGNQVIREIGSRLKSTLRESDFVSRYGGDEFAVVLDIQDSCLKTGCAGVAAKVIDKMKEPIKIDDKEILVPVNIGFSLYPHHGQEPKDLLEEADKAMYRAKHIGPNTYKFA